MKKRKGHNAKASVGQNARKSVPLLERPIHTVASTDHPDHDVAIGYVLDNAGHRHWILRTGTVREIVSVNTAIQAFWEAEAEVIFAQHFPRTPRPQSVPQFLMDRYFAELARRKAAESNESD